VRTPTPERLRGVAEALTRLFYCLMAVAFLAAVFGSPGRGFFLLVLGGLAHVARVGAEEAIELQARKPRSRRRSASRPAVSRASAPAKSPRRATA
jgi:hypothetical protein